MPKQYLEIYAEPEALLAKRLCSGCGRRQHVLTIPAFDEEPSFLFELAQRKESLLIVLVVNQTSAPITKMNQSLLDTVQEAFPAIERDQHLSFHSLGAGALLLVDRARIPLPAKTGVGLARKIAADIALQLYVDGLVENPWIYCTDADAHLPEDYFTLPSQATASGASLPFKHIGAEGKLLEATLLYEQAIRYYANGLRYTGSLYGFLSLGSAMAVMAIPYAKVRGFCRRQAGEDFYMLNKLAKLGPILTPDSSPVLIQARISNRTPFGTGMSVAQILNLDRLSDFHYYNPACFQMLRHWYDHLQTLNYEDFAAALSRLPAPLRSALAAQKVDTLITHLASSKANQSQLQTACHIWLDGFKSLKIIRTLQSHFPPQPLLATLEQNLEF